MTDQQKKIIEEHFYNCNSNDNPLWKEVFDKMIIRYKWRAEEKFLTKTYIEHKTKRRVCREVGISIRTYGYWKDKLLLDAFMFAKELNLL